MAGLLDEIEADDQLRAVVLTGAGRGVLGRRRPQGRRARRRGRHRARQGRIRRHREPRLPQADHRRRERRRRWPAASRSCSSCDLVVAADTARFGIPEVQRGLMAAAGGLIRLPKRVPLAIALELAMTGDPIDADRALALGPREPGRRPTTRSSTRPARSPSASARTRRSRCASRASSCGKRPSCPRPRAGAAPTSCARGVRERRRGRGRDRLRREAPARLEEQVIPALRRASGSAPGCDRGSDHS